MAISGSDASDPIRRKAGSYPGVEVGTSCTQAAFKYNQRAFLYIGLQGGRHKAMFRLRDSLEEAAALAEDNPEQFQVGSTAWVTVRFSDADPVPHSIWSRWLDESYNLCAAAATVRKRVGKQPAVRRSESRPDKPKKKK